ncbi:hypothetical protein SAY86_016869 [Trapa natans]|uniref:NAC domain-containing protein n=1 Tax=Trapa natans TaxID=22666 RepID=A0AAN7M4E7_TRANT|nr:hypothetical protein SAY86_016869 [Trapa natans]
MEKKLNFVKDGVLRLPPGFRFHPTDEELVVQYLKRKVYSCPLPASIIPDVDVCPSDPWDFPGDIGQERYFFSKSNVKYPNGNRSNRATVSGYWKAIGIDRQVLASSRSSNDPNRTRLVGMKMTLVFYIGKASQGTKTGWIMHEYRLALTDPCSPPQGTVMNLNQSQENWVLCRIFLKKRGSKNDDGGDGGINIMNNNNNDNNNNLRSIFYDFMGGNRGSSGHKGADLNLSPPEDRAYSGSSGVTEVSCHEQCEDHEETSSCSIRRKEP